MNDAQLRHDIFYAEYALHRDRGAAPLAALSAANAALDSLTKSTHWPAAGPSESQPAPASAKPEAWRDDVTVGDTCWALREDDVELRRFNGETWESLGSLSLRSGTESRPEIDAFAELVADLRRCGNAAKEIAVDYRERSGPGDNNAVHCFGKAEAYEHAAELAEEQAARIAAGSAVEQVMSRTLYSTRQAIIAAGLPDTLSAADAITKLHSSLASLQRTLAGVQRERDALAAMLAARTEESA